MDLKKCFWMEMILIQKLDSSISLQGEEEEVEPEVVEAQEEVAVVEAEEVLVKAAVKLLKKMPKRVRNGKN